MGGISHTLATRGLLIDTVSSMYVVTGTGEIISCSDTENRDLFRAALGGLGQYGIIVAATIALSPLPQREVAVSLYYDALCAFMGDAAHFVREQCDGLLGGMYATNLGTLYTLQVKIHPKDTETTIQARNRILEGREKDMRDLRNQRTRSKFLSLLCLNISKILVFR